jgi:hypothetical protein
MAGLCGISEFVFTFFNRIAPGNAGHCEAVPAVGHDNTHFFDQRLTGNFLAQGRVPD